MSGPRRGARGFCLAGGLLATVSGSCRPGPYGPGARVDCPEVLYEPVGDMVHHPEDCASDTCPLYCDEGVCGEGSSRGYWCEPCERLDAYFAGEGSVCVWVWDDDGTTNVFCGW